MLSEILATYLELFPDEKTNLLRLWQQISDNEKLNDRRNFHGHITGSGVVLSPDKTQILLIHHKLFQVWQQPGGHWEADDEADPLAAARREVTEETGAAVADYLPLDSTHPLVPLDIDSHQVPARPEKDEPPHWHHDFRYVFISATEELSAQLQEVSGARWFPLLAPETQRIARVMKKLPNLLASHE